VLGLQVGECRDQQRTSGGGEGRDAHATDDPTGCGREVRFGTFDLCEDALGVGDELGAGVGEPHTAAKTLKQRRAGLALQHGHLLRHG